MCREYWGFEKVLLNHLFSLNFFVYNNWFIKNGESKDETGGEDEEKKEKTEAGEDAEKKPSDENVWLKL